MIVVLLILLWSLSACYFTRLFSRIRMKLAAIACAVLYAGVTGWILFVIVFGAVDLGSVANESRKVLSLGWNVSQSLKAFLGILGVLPSNFLSTLFLIGGLIVAVGFLVVFSDCFFLIREVYLQIKKKKSRITARCLKFVPIHAENGYSFVSRLRMFCRANC